MPNFKPRDITGATVERNDVVHAAHPFHEWGRSKPLIMPWCYLTEFWWRPATMKVRDFKLRMSSRPREISCLHCAQRMAAWNQRQQGQSPPPMTFLNIEDWGKTALVDALA